MTDYDILDISPNDNPEKPPHCNKCDQDHWGLCTTPLIEHEDGSITGGQIIENSS